MTQAYKDLSDDELLRRYLDAEGEDGGEAFFAIYNRYYTTVRLELVDDGGLPAHGAEAGVGEVFVRALGDGPLSTPLRERLLLAARILRLEKAPGSP